MENNNNKIILSGRISEEPKLSHTTHGTNIFNAMIDVERKSKEADGRPKVDRLPLHIPERPWINLDSLINGNEIILEGELRSWNVLDDQGSHLKLATFVQNLRGLKSISEERQNILDLDGYICKEPNYRTTPGNPLKGRGPSEICDLLLAVNRQNSNKSDYIPAIAWGHFARFAAKTPIGARLHAKGRIESREYEKAGEVDPRVAYEASLNSFDIIK